MNVTHVPPGILQAYMQVSKMIRNKKSRICARQPLHARGHQTTHLERTQQTHTHTHACIVRTRAFRVGARAAVAGRSGVGMGVLNYGHVHHSNYNTHRTLHGYVRTCSYVDKRRGLADKKLSLCNCEVVLDDGDDHIFQSSHDAQRLLQRHVCGGFDLLTPCNSECDRRS
jgi:hypothetical protein